MGFDFPKSLPVKQPQIGLPDAIVDQLGNMMYTILISREKQLKDSENEALALKVKDELVNAAKKSNYAMAAEDFEWEVTIIDNLKVIDAKVFPGGKIVIYSGLFGLVKKNPSRLATLLGHEMGHALARHAAQRFDQHMCATITTMAAGGGLRISELDPKTTIAIMGAMGVGYAGGIAPPFAKKQELEADEMGLVLMNQAGFDPASTIAFFKDLMDKKKVDQNRAALFANHPSLNERIEFLKKLIAKL